jgi:hypothetical protein
VHTWIKSPGALLISTLTLNPTLTVQAKIFLEKEEALPYLTLGRTTQRSWITDGGKTGADCRVAEPGGSVKVLITFR